MMRMGRVDADCIDHTVHANAARKSLDRFNRIFAIEVDDLRTLLLRHFQARRDRVDREDAAGIQKLRACNHELANRTAAEHCDGAARVDTCDLCAHPGSRNDVGDKDCLIVGHSIWNSNHADICKRNARIFGLEAIKRPTRGRTAEERCPRFGTIWVCLVALRVVTGAAIRAISARDGGWNHNAIAGLEVAHSASYFLNDTHAFVSQNGSRLHTRYGAANHMEISATDRARREPHNRVVWFLDLRLRNVFQANIAHTAKHYCFHGELLFNSFFFKLEAIHDEWVDLRPPKLRKVLSCST